MNQEQIDRINELARKSYRADTGGERGAEKAPYRVHCHYPHEYAFPVGQH